MQAACQSKNSHSGFNLGKLAILGTAASAILAIVTV